MEKAKRLAARGEDVVFIVAFYEWYRQRRKRVLLDVDETKHFLCQALKKDFSDFTRENLKDRGSISVEFVKIWDVLGRVKQVVADKKQWTSLLSKVRITSMVRR